MAALPDPHNVARIYEVQDPSDNQFVVTVLMPFGLASKFPSKPWGTPITDIGLTKKEADLYPDYVLVDIEPLKGSDDLKWVFQKLSGPMWKETKNSRENLTPQKYRGMVTMVKTTQEVVPSTLPSPLIGDVVLDDVAQSVDTGKAVQTIITEQINENANPLIGQIAYVEKEVADTSEALVPDGTPATHGLLVSSSRVDPIGNGKSVKSDITVPSWTTHYGQDYDRVLNIPLPYSEYFAPPGTGIGQLDTTVTPVNKDRVHVVEQAIPGLDNFIASSPCRVQVDLPRVLDKASVVFSTSDDIGTQELQFENVAYTDSYNLGDSHADSANSSATIAGDLQLVWKDYGNGNVPGIQYVFYLKNPVTEADIRGRLNAKYWPVFITKSQCVSITTHSIRIRANAMVALNASRSNGTLTQKGYKKGVSDDFGVSVNINTIQIASCLCDTIDLGEDTETTVEATAIATMNSTDNGSITAIKTKSGTAYGKIFPKTLEATTQIDIPKEGIYIANARVRNYGWGYAEVIAETFDASIFNR